MNYIYKLIILFLLHSTTNADNCLICKNDLFNIKICSNNTLTIDNFYCSSIINKIENDILEKNNFEPSPSSSILGPSSSTTILEPSSSSTILEPSSSTTILEPSSSSTILEPSSSSTILEPSSSSKY